MTLLTNIIENIQNGSVSSVNGHTGEVVLTKEDIKLNYVENIKQASETEFNLHKTNTQVHLSDGDKDKIDMIPNIQSNLDDKIGLKVFNEHAQNTTHITPEERISWNNKVDKELDKHLSTNDFTDEYKTKIDTNGDEIVSIKESLGNMKGIIISSEEPTEVYEGLIWIKPLEEG